MRGESLLWQDRSLSCTPWLSALEAYMDHPVPQPKTVPGFTAQSERQNPPSGPKTLQNLLLPLDSLNWSRILLAHSAPHTLLFSLSFTYSWSFCLLFYLPGVLFRQISLRGAFPYFLQAKITLQHPSLFYPTCFVCPSIWHTA